ncbi:GNAT superfamily N-acetyltransferase [Dysgonomonas sp. PFB1-18]|uniref:GNAT family N-acetyltransferase n=1 Tax=unclassified Dysgonomonas TaxID=2630389 RepID=UPI0024749F5E|nr:MULTISPECIES: GNAT family N-acetyltransferase [unclassified Dysgonomonas]MDH6309269.1 GNAT superfamily N-acetyltransferase [Dysgonomonas sp. PF1-14]MDH6338851.1 GNAT superfamily N-acetyltransferase [Dysgonomonas sp. PF1-16]MDH6380518.1 GNAT superfamily N-acetyltransferase [Dysgonomonas sp. PFB1-18]MDH6397679.1 GNAT superfamily N-acetyltransferase [Dysgonomonas sp. PF1-23]
MEIVEASKDHIFVIRLLADKIWPLAFQEILTKEQTAYMMEMMYSADSLENQMDNGHHYLLAKDGDEYLGYVSYELNYKDTDATKIHKIYVLPSLQGTKGVGRSFIEAVTEKAKENGNKELSLNVNRFNKAINFYNRMGFEIARSEDIDIGNGFLMQDYVMNKKL